MIGDGGADARRRARRQIAIYGKGGIGKSTTVSNLAVLFGMEGQRVLLVGCDPKHDTSYKVCDARPVPTVLGLLQQRRSHDLTLDDFFIRGRHGVSCIEAGGPEPGVGCAGRGLSKMFELFESMDLYAGDHDVVLYDVLGDVVCGGFAVPMRKAYATEILVVVSGEIMSLYAANNICRALVRLSSGGVRLMGLIGNMRDVDGEEAVIAAFAERLGSRVLATIRRDNLILEAESHRKTVVEYAPDSMAAGDYRNLRDAVAALREGDGVIPRAMGEAGFDEFVRTRLLPAPDRAAPAPEAPPAGFQPDRFCTWLARALSGKTVHCQEVLFERDGHLSIRLAAEDERVELLLGPRRDPRSAPSGGGVTVDEVTEDELALSLGSLRPATDTDARRPWRKFARHVARRLEAIHARYRVPLLRLLRLDEPEEVFSFGPGLFHWRIGELLVPGQTRYGPFVYAGEHFDGEDLLHRFESAEGTVVLRLHMRPDHPGALFRTRHLSFTLDTDERAEKERSRPEHQVERYLGFLVALSDPPTARYDVPHRTEAIVAGSTQDWGSELSAQFFADPGYDFLANYYTAFGLRWPVAYLFHGERECSHMGTYSPAPFQSFVEHPMHVRPRRGMSDRVFVTDLTEADAVMGGEARLKEALLEVGNRPGVGTVIVQDTCVVRVVGDDIRRCIAEVQDRVRAPLLYLDATAMDDAAPFEAISRFWRELLESTADPDPAPRPGAVNLVGYGLTDDPSARELSALLARVGVSVNAWFLPGLDREEARRFRAAGHDIVTPWRYGKSAFEDASRWSGRPTHSPPLPYGRAGTRRWLEEIHRVVLEGDATDAPEAGLSAAVPDMEGETLARWERLRRRAGGLGAAFGLVSTQAPRLLDAPGSLGTPVVRCLGEMGFAVHVLCFDPPRVRDAAERVPPEQLEGGLRGLLGAEGRLEMHVFEDIAELPALLASEGFSLVYSEIRDDPRLRAAGKAQIHLGDFEMGFGGAVRTLDRLLRRTRPTLGDRFSRYLRAEG